MGRFLVTLVSLTLIAGVMSIQSVATGFLFFTVGLAFPLVYSATLVAYGICLIPVIAVWKSDRTVRLLFGTISIGLMAMLAIVPGQLATQDARNAANAMMTGDRPLNGTLRATSLEIRRKTADYSGLFLDSKPCGIECRTLLLGKKMRWVRVVMVDGGRARPRKRKQPTSTFYKAASGNECALPGSRSPSPRQCVLMVPDNGAIADLIINLTNGDRGQMKHLPDTSFYRWLKWRRITARQRQGTKFIEKYHQTEVEAAVVMMPLMIGPEFSGISSNGTVLQKIKKRFNRVSLARTLRALGFDIQKPEAALPVKSRRRKRGRGVDDDMTRDLLSVLNLPQTENFNREQGLVISHWVGRARSTKTWTPQLVELLRRITRDRRMRLPSYVGQIIKRNPQIAKELLPDVIYMLETHGVDNDYTVARQVAFAFKKLEPALLKPYAGRIVALLGKSEKMHQTLLPSIGRFGIDPTPYLAPISDNPNDKSRTLRLRGACLSEKKWAHSLIPHVQRAVGSRHHKLARYLRRNTSVYKTLANLGDIAFVEQDLASGRYDKKDAKRLLKRIRWAINYKHYPNRVCNF